MSRSAAPRTIVGAGPAGSARSLERTLPLLMTAVYAVGLAAMLAVTYTMLVRRVDAIVRDRLTHAVTEVARALGAAAEGRAELGALPPAGEALREALRAAPAGARPPAPGALAALGDIERAVREVAREEIVLSLRDADGATWVTPRGRAPAPARRTRRMLGGGGGLAYERADGRSIAAEAPVAGTAWVAVLESPERWLAQRPRRTIEELALLSAALTLVGGALSWLASGRITRPLAAITAAAEELASGTYEHPVAVAGSRDEIGRLAASFDGMARQVAAARRELERRAADAQATAAELAAANAQLRLAMADAERARGEAEAARAEAERASRAKGDFLAVMSHELRTPLNAIGGYAELLALGIYGPLTDAQQDAVARMERSKSHLLRLIDDVLSFARIDAGQMPIALAEVPLHDTLASLEALVAPQMRARRLTLDWRACPASLAAHADADKLRQVVLNLLANAIKFTPEGGTITLSCDADEDAVRVRVRDTGVGIAPDRLASIFEPFVQGERALNRPSEGVGLGLAISRELARAMGGELVAESAPGAGSRFTLTLRRAGAGSGAGALSAAPLSATAPR